MVAIYEIRCGDAVWVGRSNDVQVAMRAYVNRVKRGLGRLGEQYKAGHEIKTRIIQSFRHPSDRDEVYDDMTNFAETLTEIPRKQYNMVCGVVRYRIKEDGRWYYFCGGNIYHIFANEKRLLRNGQHHCSELQREYNMDVDNVIFSVEILATGVDYFKLNSIKKQFRNTLGNSYPVSVEVRKKPTYINGKHKGLRLIKEGVVYTVDNPREFAKEHGMAVSTLYKLANGQNKKGITHGFRTYAVEDE